MYPAESPVQTDYLYQTKAALDELLRQRTPLTVTVRRASLWWEAEVVHEDEDPEGGLLIGLAREGIEDLSFFNGITVDELRRLAEVFSSVTSTHATGEAAVRLWCLDVTHFRYRTSDPFDPVAPTSRGLNAEFDRYRQLILHITELAGASEPVADALAGWSPPPPLPWAEALEADLFDRHRHLAAQDDLGPLMARASVLLLGALGAEAEPKADTPAWRLLTELLRAVVGHGHFADAQSLLDRMEDYGERSGSPNVQRMLTGVRGWLGSEEVMRPVMTIMEQTTEPAKLADAMGYLSRLGPSIDPALWALASLLRSDVARHHVAELLVSSAERDPDSAIAHLPRQSSGLMTDLVVRAEQRRSPNADLLWWFGLEHHDPMVRAPATKLLRHRDGPTAAGVLLERLQDSDVQVRIAAIDAVGGRQRQALLNAIQTYFKLEKMQQASETELGIAMLAFARVLGPRAVPQLAHVLSEGHRLRLGPKTVPVQVKAAQVLGAIPDQSAVKALQNGLQTRTPKIKATCQRALEGYFGQTLQLDPVRRDRPKPAPGGAKAADGSRTGFGGSEGRFAPPRRARHCGATRDGGRPG